MINREISINKSIVLLVIGFGSILSVLAIILLQWMQSINESTVRLHHLEKEYYESTLVFKMADTTHKRATGLYKMIELDNRAERINNYKQMILLKETFNNSKAELTKLDVWNKKEKGAWGEVEPLMEETSNNQSKAMEYVLNNKITKAKKILKHDIIPVQNSLTRKLDKMLVLHKEEIEEIIEEDTHFHNETLITLVTLTTTIMAIGLLLSAYIIRHIYTTDKKLVVAQETAQAANRNKSIFLSNMSHEIRTPLTSIIGYANALCDKDTSKNEKEEHVNTIIRNGQHLLRIINDILDLSKIESNKLEAEIIDVNTIEVFDEVNDIMRHKAMEKDLYYHDNLVFPIPEQFKSDPTRLKQVLLNLIGNAIKFTSEGSITISCSYSENSHTLNFMVSDTGIGMSEEALKKVFDPFSQADSSTTRKFGGTGLGLSIARQLTNILGGNLHVKSQPGRGTTFTVMLKLSDSDEANLLNARPEKPSMTPHSQEIQIPKLRGSVLVADDSKDIRNLVSMYIGKCGAEIGMAENGQIAVDKALSDDYDLILLDMQMPVMNGPTAARKLRELGYKKPIVILTANVMKDNIQQFNGIEIQGYLSKPIELKNFYEVMSNNLAIRDIDNDDYIKQFPELRELKEQFKKQLVNYVQDVINAINQNDFDEVERVCHILKGLAGSFGYHELTNKASELEKSAKQHDENHLKENVVQFDMICNHAINT